MSAKTRLDQALVARGLSESREKAQRAIMAGQVYVNGQKADKPGSRIAGDAMIEIQCCRQGVAGKQNWVR